MKAVFLAGGLGTRISEETHLKPKPMIEIGGKPLLWHLFKFYSSFGVNDFIVCCGYKGYVIKEYFANYFLHTSDVTFEMSSGEMHVHRRYAEPWTVTLVETGELTNTAGRLKRVGDYLGDQPFCFTYGDGLSDVNIKKLIETYHKTNCKALVTAVQPPGRYGTLKIETNNIVKGFSEKPEGEGGWINGGFFVADPSVLNLISGDDSSWEVDILPKLASQHQLSAFHHHGFWQAMDTLRERNYLEKLWASGEAPWKLWK